MAKDLSAIRKALKGNVDADPSGKETGEGGENLPQSKTRASVRTPGRPCRSAVAIKRYTLLRAAMA
ncbi:hypothetical protein NKH19_11210 [Mesorhizobium sp. M1338]|uniref:hypothetical protein n=1 Tax=unclassified Mesorhizobium TaxID=325217 RepID=UPI00333D971A